MQRDKSYEDVIEEIVEEANKKAYEPDGMYTLGKKFRLDWKRISKIMKFDLYEGYDPKKGRTEYPSDGEIADVFYRHRRNRHRDM